MKFLRVDDVKELLQISESSAYNVIKDLNEELSKKGYLSVRGRVQANYFYDRFGFSLCESSKGGTHED